MTRIHVTSLLALAAFWLLAPTVSAQISFDPRIDERKDNCGSVGASRTRARSRANCEQEQTTTAVEQEIKLAIDLPDLEISQCEATSTTQYQQRNTIARVDTTVAVGSCAAASGEHTVTARIRDSSGEVKSIEFEEKWQRSDGQDVKLTADYPIGENVDLLSVRVRGLSCTCADPPPDAVAGAPSPTPAAAPPN